MWDYVAAGDHLSQGGRTVSSCHAPRSAAMWLVIVTGVACASSSEMIYVAPSPETITTYLEAGYDGRSQNIVVRNSSTVEIVVTSINITTCDNITNPCGVRRLQVSVKPGNEERIATIRTANTARRTNFRYRWTWQHGADVPDIPTSLPPDTVAAEEGAQHSWHRTMIACGLHQLSRGLHYR